VVVPPEFICPITRDIMLEPVVDREGHTFERAAIEHWVVEHHNTCPISRAPLELADLVPNRALHDAIERFRVEVLGVVLPEHQELQPAPPEPSAPPMPQL